MIFNIRELIVSNYISYNDTTNNTILFEAFFNNEKTDITTQFGPQNESSISTIKHNIAIKNSNINYIDDILFESLCDTSSKNIGTQNIKPITFAPNFPLRVYI